MFDKYLTRKVEDINQFCLAQDSVLKNNDKVIRILVQHVKSIHTQCDDLQLQLNGLMQLTLKPLGKKKVKKAKEREAYVEIKKEVNDGQNN